jgi:predicted ATPase/DNA-binding winged helix-turn-helix (wHTH) protein
MSDARILTFGPFRLDLSAERLWRGTETVPLTAKALAVLRYLVDHAGQLVPRDALLQAVWGTLYVSDAALASCIRDIRRALGDQGQKPQYVETIRGRGYRFLASVTDLSRPPAPLATVPSPPSVSRGPALLVGRDTELVRLHQGLAAALQGARQIVFVTGEAGIGKTMLVDTFVAQAVTEEIWLGRGQCIEQYGSGEAYLPLLEAFGRLGRSPDGAPLMAVLTQHAPSWLVQMPALLSNADLTTLQQRTSGTTRERMLRELAEVVEVLTAARLLVLVLEDLHWSDGATLDWLAYVARRREPARLLVLGTYRPVEALVRTHPVRMVTQDLQMRGQCVELVLEYLSEVEVAAYLTQRFVHTPLLPELACVLHQRTTGNPLFLAATVDSLVQQGVLRQGTTGWELAGGLEALTAEVPESLRQLIERQIEQLRPEEQELLEAASVAGKEFAVAVVAAAVGRTVDEVEARCAILARRGQALQACGTDTWPDGTVATRYSFRHDFYRETLYARIPVGRRVRWHQQIGVRLEAGYGPRVWELATEVAAHFVRGRDTARAVPYLQYAGEQAIQRSAHQEAIAHFTHALELLQGFPDTAERAAQELQVRMALGPALMTRRGYADPDVAHTYSRARELCQRVDETSQLFPVLWGLWQFANGSAQHRSAQELGERLLTVAQQSRDPVHLLQAHHALWTTAFNRGDFLAAMRHAEHGMDLYTAQHHHTHILLYGVDEPEVCCRSFAAQTLWFLGYPEQAIQRSAEALTLAQDLAHPFSLAHTLSKAALVHQLRRDVLATHERAEAVLTLGTEHGFPYMVAVGTMLRGWVLAMQAQRAEGIATLRQALAALQTAGTEHWQPWCCAALADAYRAIRQADDGLAVLADAFAIVEATGERMLAAELYRLQGVLLLQQASPDVHQAETCFQHALAIAHQQQAKSLELRAAMSLSRLWLRQDKRDESRALLVPIYDWFTEGFDTADLQEAQALLAML